MNASSESGEWATRIVRLIMTPSGNKRHSGCGSAQHQRADVRPEGQAGECDGQVNVTNHASSEFLQTDSPPSQEMPVTGNSLWLRGSRRPAYASAGVFRADHQQQEKMQMPKFFR